MRDLTTFAAEPHMSVNIYQSRSFENKQIFKEGRGGKFRTTAQEASGLGRIQEGKKKL